MILKADPIAARPPDNDHRHPGRIPGPPVPILPALTRQDCRDLAACYSLLAISGTDKLSAPREAVVRTLIAAIWSGAGL